MPPPTPHQPPPPPLDPPFRGYIESTLDSLLVFEAARRGMIPRVTRRLIERERGMVQSGAVFVFDEHESGIKRWTDGLIWSPSRILGNFLVYRETDKRNPATALPPTTTSASPPHNRSPSSSSYEYEQVHMQVQIQRPQLSAASISGLDQAQAMARRESVGEGSFKGQGGQGGMDKGKERQLVGSLTNSYRFKEGGLVKKTMSVNVNGFAQHMVSYYSVSDVLAGRLRTPSTIPELMALEISPEYLQRQNFRFPPVIDVGEDGVPRYGGEPADEPGSPTGAGPGANGFPPQYSSGSEVTYSNRPPPEGFGAKPSQEFLQSAIRIVPNPSGSYRPSTNRTSISQSDLQPLPSPGELSPYATSQNSNVQGYFDIQPQPPQLQYQQSPGYSSYVPNQDVKPSMQELQASLSSSWARPSPGGGNRPPGLAPTGMARQASDSSAQGRGQSRYTPYSHSPTSPGFSLGTGGGMVQQSTLKMRRQSEHHNQQPSTILHGFTPMNGGRGHDQGMAHRASVSGPPTSASYTSGPGYLSPAHPRGGNISPFQTHSDQLQQQQQQPSHSLQQQQQQPAQQQAFPPSQGDIHIQSNTGGEYFTTVGNSTFPAGAMFIPHNGSAPVPIQPTAYAQTAGAVPSYSSGWPTHDGSPRIDTSNRPMTATSVRPHRSFSGPGLMYATAIGGDLRTSGNNITEGVEVGAMEEPGSARTMPLMSPVSQNPGTGHWMGGGEMQSQQAMAMGRVGSGSGGGTEAGSMNGNGNQNGNGNGTGSAHNVVGTYETYHPHQSHFQPQQHDIHHEGYQNHQMMGRA